MALTSIIACSGLSLPPEVRVWAVAVVAAISMDIIKRVRKIFHIMISVLCDRNTLIAARQGVNAH
jgi:hypothetical protein